MDKINFSYVFVCYESKKKKRYLIQFTRLLGSGFRQRLVVLSREPQGRTDNRLFSSYLSATHLLSS